MSTEDLSINDESSYAASTEYAVPEAESDESNTNRGRKRRAEGDASSNGALAHKKEEEEETSGKRVRKKNRMYDDDYSMGGEKASSKSKRDVLLSPDQVREKEKALPKGYAYTLVPVEDPPKASLVTSGKRERKKRVDADFVENNGKPLPVKKPTTPASGSKRTKSSDDTENEAYVTPKNPKKTKSEQSRQAKLESTLTALNDQLALVSQSIQKNKVKVKTEPSPAPVQAVASPVSAAAQYTEDPEEMENGGDHDMAEEAYTPTAPKSSASKARKTRSSEAGSSHGRRTPRSEHPSPSPSPSTKNSSGGRSHRAIKRRASSPGEISGALSKCEKIISDLLKHPDSWPFRKPVDPVKLHIPDYFDIIKRPMDLGTVKNQLRAGQYLTPDDMAEDVRLVFWNTRTYNPPTDDVVMMANNLESIFDEKFKAAIKEDVFDEDGTSLKDKVNQLSKNLLSAKEEIKKWKEKATAPAPATSPGLVAATTPSKPKGRTPKEDNRVMTFDEKRRLSMNINKLPAEKLGKVIQIIHERSPKLAQSSAPDEIEIDIDALDTVTLRCLERYAKSVLTRERKSSAGASLSRKQQVDITASGTQEKIRDVERQLNELNRSLEAKTPGRRGGKKKGGDRDEDVVIDDNAPAENYPSVHIEKDAADHSDSGSDSESSSESSDSESSSSDSDSDSSATSSASSDSENKTNGGSNSSSKKRSLQKDLAPGGQTTQHHPTSRPAITNTDQPQPTPTNNHTSPPLSAPPPTSPPMQLHQEKVIFTLEKPVHTPPTAENTEVAPEIKQSTSTKKAPELPTTVMASWTSLLETSSTSSTPSLQQSTPPTDLMWSQFQNKNIQQKQKEKEREEQEELLRREREEREEEKKREEERKRREAEEAELKRQRDTEAENEQKKQALMAQRAAARAAREMIVGKNMTEQSNLMASFENETRSQQASLLDLHLKPVDVKNSSDVPPSSKPTEPEEGEL